MFGYVHNSTMCNAALCGKFGAAEKLSDSSALLGLLSIIMWLVFRFRFTQYVLMQPDKLLQE